jgi:hypothetical protein
MLAVLSQRRALRLFARSPLCLTRVPALNTQLGLKHCIYFTCLMNGVNHDGELEMQPLYLCPGKPSSHDSVACSFVADRFLALGEGPLACCALCRLVLLRGAESAFAGLL